MPVVLLSMGITADVSLLFTAYLTVNRQYALLIRPHRNAGVAKDLNDILLLPGSTAG